MTTQPQTQPKSLQHAKTYECVAVDVSTQDCTLWRATEHTLPISKADAAWLTGKIIGFMAFVFILKLIKKSL